MMREQKKTIRINLKVAILISLFIVIIITFIIIALSNVINNTDKRYKYLLDKDSQLSESEVKNYVLKK